MEAPLHLVDELNILSASSPLIPRHGNVIPLLGQVKLAFGNTQSETVFLMRLGKYYGVVSTHHAVWAMWCLSVLPVATENL